MSVALREPSMTDETAAWLHSNGLTLREIGRIAGISGERVRQKINRHGRLPRTWKSREEMAEEFGCSPGAISRACQRLGIKDFRFDEAQQESLRSDFQRTCACGVKFNGGVNRAWCSRECREQALHGRKGHLSTCSRAATEETTTPQGSPRIALEAVNNVTDPGSWISFGEALKLCGLSHMQLSWLWRRGIIRSKASDVFHPVTGRPVRLYSANEMLAIWNATHRLGRPSNR